MNLLPLIKMAMFAIKGIYDGKSVELLEKLTDHRKYKVVVTFLEEIETTDEVLKDITSQKNSYNFWNNTRDAVYLDFLIHKLR